MEKKPQKLIECQNKSNCLQKKSNFSIEFKIWNVNLKDSIFSEP